jgi:gamma-glutamylcyclotransferase (GGCT)/AIG2-like uncharacterized protein YtfP
MTGPIHYLFVYGSLRSGFRSAAYEYISRYFQFVSAGKVRGQLFDMGIYPAAVPTSGDYFIIGELYKIKNENEFAWAMGQLDDYEGVNTEVGETRLYQRDIAEVFSEIGSTPAWIYWYTGAVQGHPVIESGDVIQYLEQKK